MSTDTRPRGAEARHPGHGRRRLSLPVLLLVIAGGLVLPRSSA